MATGYKPPLSRASKVPRSQADFPPATTGNIAAIEIVTTSISLAYTTVIDERINMVTLGSRYKGDTRVSNTILLKKEPGENISVRAIGNTARKEYTEIPKYEQIDYIYFENISITFQTGTVS